MASEASGAARTAGAAWSYGRLALGKQSLDQRQRLTRPLHTYLEFALVVTDVSNNDLLYNVSGSTSLRSGGVNKKTLPPFFIYKT